jgi:hypothetical protein
MGSGILIAAVMVIPSFSKVTNDYVALAKTQAENSNQVTLLFDPKANYGLAMSGKPMTEVYSGDRATPYIGYPRWIIAGKVKPLIAGDAVDVKYSYYDPRTNQYDGPYVPATPTLRP